MSGSKWRLALMGVAGVLLAGSAAAEGLGLRNDPFVRPNLNANAAGGAASGAAGGSDRGAAEAPWQPRLRAVVVAGPRSSVLVDGQVVEMGGEVDGYRLIRVLPDKAIFVRNGRRVELTLAATRAP